MRATDLITETWEALDANRGRSLLTVLGIVIGISAVISMTALIGGITLRYGGVQLSDSIQSRLDRLRRSLDEAIV